MIFETSLPGNSIQVIDEYNTSVFDSSAFGTTESVLLIGTAFDGPVGKEVKIYNPEHAAYIFGNSYDYKTRRSATLVPYVQDLYNQGCRTIYAMRVGGKDLFKTYKLKEDVPVYLKLSSLFPSNKYKDMCMSIKDGHLTIYKTANKATIEEKRDGIVESTDSIVSFSININDPYGIDTNTRLVDMLEAVNGNIKNNVFSFSLVDNQGVDVTHSPIAQSLCVGTLLEGVYTIGRVDKKAVAPVTTVTAEYINDTNKPYKDYQGKIVLDVVTNTSINAMYPYILASFDYAALKIFGALDNFSEKDNVDYEEVNMAPFELYKKLGSGYAQTAKLVNVGTEVVPRFVVRPTPKEESSFAIEIAEGIYSTASNLKADYRVLTCAYADAKIQGKLPSVDAFEKASIVKIPFAYTGVTPKPFVFAAYKKEDDFIANFKFNIKSAQTLPTVPEGFENQENIPIVNLEAALSGEGFKIVDFGGAYWIANGTADSITVLMALDQYKTDSSYVISVSKTEGASGALDTYTFEISVLESYMASLNGGNLIADIEETPLAHLFSFAVDNALVNETVVGTPASNEVKPNKEINSNQYTVIPYTTSDNFVRQLAQHAEYTSLKTCQTHAVIGVAPIVNTSLKSVAEQVEKLVNTEYDLYVKNGVGRQVLDINNLPYHIGKSVSIVAEQHTLPTTDGFKMNATGAAGYVGRASNINKDTSTTNQAIGLVPHFEYGESQKVILNKKGYVTLSMKDGIYRITDGVTQAPQLSQFSRFATFRTMKLVDGVIREAIDPFIGKKNDLTNRNTMYTAIKSGMEALLGTYLESYSFKMNYNKHAARLGNIDIDYTIDIVNEIRNVKNRVTAKSK